MAVTVGSVVLRQSSPRSREGVTPSGGGLARVFIPDATTPNAGGVSKTALSEGVTPSGGGNSKVSSVEGVSPNGGGLSKVASVEGVTPNAGTTTEVEVANVMGVPLDGSERPAKGSVGAYKAGAAFSDRDSFEHTEHPQPGITITADDVNTVGQERARYRYRIDAEVELDRRTVDLVVGGTPTIFTATADQARVIPTRILLYAVDVSGVSVQPEIDLRKTALGDVLVQTALAFTATGQGSELACNSVREVLQSLETLQLGAGVLATATTYQVEVITLGRVIPA